MRERLAGGLADDAEVDVAQLLEDAGRERRVVGGAGLLLGGLERVLEQLAVDVEHDPAVHGDEAAVRVVGEALVAGDLGEALARSASLRPRLRTVSIMPGIENLAPERTDTSSGSLGSPSLRPIVASRAS